MPAGVYNSLNLVLTLHLMDLYCNHGYINIMGKKPGKIDVFITLNQI